MVMINPRLEPPLATGPRSAAAGAIAQLIHNATQVTERSLQYPGIRFHREVIEALGTYILGRTRTPLATRKKLHVELMVAATPLYSPDWKADIDIDAVAQRIAGAVDFRDFGVAVRRLPGRPLRAARHTSRSCDDSAPCLGLAGLADPDRYYHPSWHLLTAKSAMALVHEHYPAEWVRFVRIDETHGSVVPRLSVQLTDINGAVRGWQPRREARAIAGEFLTALRDPATHRELERHVAEERRRAAAAVQPLAAPAIDEVPAAPRRPRPR